MSQAVRNTLILTVALFTAITASPVFALLIQETDVIIYLNDDIVIRGTIVSEIPGLQVTIRMLDGEEVRINIQDIREIKRGKTRVRTPQIAPNRKEPALAAGLSCLLPGLGQWYNGDIISGCAFAGGSMLGYGLVFAGAEQMNSGSDGEVAVLVGLGILTASWAVSIIEAFTDAQSINAMNERKLQRHLSIKPITNANDVGGQLVFRF